MHKQLAKGKIKQWCAAQGPTGGKYWWDGQGQQLASPDEAYQLYYSSDEDE